MRSGAALGITDDFMFGTVFMNMELCKRLVEILLGIQVDLVRPVERQVRLDGGPLARAGVVDLLVRDSNGKFIDVEMQNDVRRDLARRARYYQSLIDFVMLGPGQNFGELGDQVVVFICAHDPLWEGTQALRGVTEVRGHGSRPR